MRAVTDLTIRSVLRGVAAALLLLSAAACTYFTDDELVIEEDIPVEVIFAQAQAAMDAGDHQQAARLFDEVERLYPASTFAKRSIILSAFASYSAGDFDRAILTAGRFLEFYPSDEQADFAQYIIALSHYDQIVDVGRDQERTRAALQALRELIARYPDSEYARDAQLKLELALDHLAGKEMEIGRYYLQNREYIAAINRFRTVIERFQQTSHTAEALHRLVEAYLALGVVSEAQTAAAVLGHNFPGSEWYRDSFALLTGRDLAPLEDEGSWISRTWGRVFDGDWI